MSKAKDILLRQAFSVSDSPPGVDWAMVAEEADDGLYLDVWGEYEKACGFDDLFAFRAEPHCLSAVTAAAAAGLTAAAYAIFKRYAEDAEDATGDSARAGKRLMDRADDRGRARALVDKLETDKAAAKAKRTAGGGRLGKTTV